MAGEERTSNPECTPRLLGPISHGGYIYNCTDVNVHWCCHVQQPSTLQPFLTPVLVNWGTSITISLFSVLSNACSFVVFNQRDFIGKSIPMVLQLKYVAIIGLALSSPFTELVNGYNPHLVTITSAPVCNGFEFFLDFCSTLCNWSELFVSCFRFARNLYPVKTFVPFQTRKPAIVAAQVAVLIAIVCSVYNLVRPSHTACLFEGRHFCAWRPNPEAQYMLFIVGFFIPIMVSLMLLILLGRCRRTSQHHANNYSSEVIPEIPRRAQSLSFASSAIFFVSNLPLLVFELVSLKIQEGDMGCWMTFQQEITYDVVSCLRLLGLSLDYVVFLAISPPLRRHTSMYIRSRLRSIETIPGRSFVRK